MKSLTSRIVASFARVTLVSTLAVVLASCEEGPGLQGQDGSHPIEGSWVLTGVRGTLNGYDDNGARSMEVPDATDLLAAGLESRETFAAGTRTTETRTAADPRWTRRTEEYVVDDHRQRILLLGELTLPTGNVLSASVLEYEMDGRDSLTLSSRLEVNPPTKNLRNFVAPFTVHEVWTHMEFERSG